MPLSILEQVINGHRKSQDSRKARNVNIYWSYNGKAFITVCERFRQVYFISVMLLFVRPYLFLES